MLSSIPGACAAWLLTAVPSGLLHSNQLSAVSFQFAAYWPPTTNHFPPPPTFPNEFSLKDHKDHKENEISTLSLRSLRSLRLIATNPIHTDEFTKDA
jgi:hypothetical protein